MPTKNVVFSEITADLSASWTSLTVKTGEWVLFEQWMIATLEQMNADWKATAREVVLINNVSWNTITITRWYEQCVMNDLASPKEMWNTPQAFTTWARLSVYVSKALLNWVQTRLEQVNKPCNTQVYNDTMALNSCILNNCNDWRDKLIAKKACDCYNDKWFWSGCDWDCVMSWNVFLCANKEYEFNNLTIEEWACVRFEWQGVPTIRVKRVLCNMWVIDLRWWTFVWCCSKCDVYSWTSISNNADQSAYNAMCFGCWWAGWDWWCSWWNATASCGWDWWNAENGCYRVAPTPADWCNGWNGAEWDSCPRNNRQCWSGGWWWWVWLWNGWNGWHGASWSTSDSYSMDGWDAWAGWNGWIWWRWWDGWWNGGWYASWTPWRWWNWYIGWNAWFWNGWRDCMSSWNAVWWNGIIQGWKGSDHWRAFTNWWDWWCAINNMYWLLLYACEIINSNICAKGWIGWDWWCNAMPRSYARAGWAGWCWANWWKVFVWYFRDFQEWLVDVSGWEWWKGWASGDSALKWADWTPWTAWSFTKCKIF